MLNNTVLLPIVFLPTVNYSWEIGLGDCDFQPNLDALIMHNMEIDDSDDETFQKYNAIIEKRSRKIEDDHDSIMKQALKAYTDLMEMKKNCKIA